MAETSIQWTSGPNGEPGYTFNPWIGCQRVSPGCEHCYAEVRDHHWRPGNERWGPKAARERTSPANWLKPLKWDAEARAAGQRRKVFCASLADVFEDRAELAPWRQELFALIEATRHLDWLLLTKRPENIERMIPTWGWPPSNVWLGTTVEDQQRANERIHRLRAVPAVVHFLSVEPQLERVVLPRFCTCGCGLTEAQAVREAMNGGAALNREQAEAGISTTLGIDWVICGGESGPGARSFDIEWARSLRDQCKAAGVAFFMKQLGQRTRARPSEVGGDPELAPMIFPMRKREAGNPMTWPADLRVRQFPEVRHG